VPDDGSKRSKFAVTDFESLISTVHVPAPVHAALQPVNV
jgi:hypothetical protein